MRILSKLKKEEVIGFFVAQPKNFTMYRTKRRQKRKRKITHRRTREQTGGFLDLYDFAYTGRDVVNQVAKVAPGVIKGATNEINNIVQQRLIIK